MNKILEIKDKIGQKTEPMVNAISKLSRLHKILICIGVFALMVYPFIQFSYMPKNDEIKKLTSKLEKLDKDLREAKQKASKLKQFREEMKAVEREFALAKKALPESEEIPTLLTNISRSGQEAGLEFLLFQPKKDIEKDFYAEIPVEIKVAGRYHNVAIFFDKLARLSRIVNITDFSITKSDKRGAEELSDPNELTTLCTAVTYRFIEKEEDNPKASTKRKK